MLRPGNVYCGMRITDQTIDQLFAKHGKVCGGVRNDYFGLAFLLQEYRLSEDEAIPQVAFGGNDYGVDGFHFDRDRRNLYLFQFKYSDSYQQFKVSFQRLIDAGMPRLFDASDQDSSSNLLVQQIKSSLRENRNVIDSVYIHFVFMGDPQAAEQSKVLEDLKETLENKKFHIEKCLGHEVTLAVEFKSAKSRRVGGGTHVQRSRIYPLHMGDVIDRDGPTEERMHVGFVRLVDLRAIYADMGQRFFERNIRAALPPEGGVNKVLKATFKRIVLDEKEPPQVFAFNHNGVTIYAEALEHVDGVWKVSSPRLLNGAQTVTTFDRFLKENEANPRLTARKAALDAISVMCRIITSSEPEFVTTVTINNNRQNPVEPWNLRANDRIQLELADKLRDEVGLYYERQENAFDNLTDVDVGELEVEGYKAVELYRLAQTFAVVDGEIDKLGRMREVFEDERPYSQLFNESRLKADSRKIILCYKAGLYVSRLMREVRQAAQNKYDFVTRGRNLLWALVCQGMLNDPKINELSEEYGQSLKMEIQFRKWLLDLATRKCRLILADLIAEKAYKEKVAEDNFTFLKTTAAFKKSMDIAYKRYKWTVRSLS